MKYPAIPLYLILLLLAGCAGSPVRNAMEGLRQVERSTNIIYDEVTGGRLDLYRPVDARGETVVLFLNSDRWARGSKEQFEFVGQALAARGLVAVLPDLRKYPDVRFPAFVDDAASAAKWVRENIGRYGGNADRVFVMGHSAGAHIAALLALDEQYLKRVGAGRQWLRGMIGISGPYDFMPITAPDLRDLFGPPEDFEQSQPIFHVDGRNPPLLLMHSEDDSEVSVRNTRNLARAVRAADGPVETVIYLDQGHRGILESLAPGRQGRTDAMGSLLEFTASVLEGRMGPVIRGKAFNEPEALPEGQALPEAQPSAPKPLMLEMEPAGSAASPAAAPAPTPAPQPAPAPAPAPARESAPAAERTAPEAQPEQQYRPSLQLDDRPLRGYGVEVPPQ
jgi:acetyl esterase/lipase